VNQIALQLQISKKEIGPELVVGLNAADLCSCNENVIRPFYQTVLLA